jgi:hypothetical protein
MEQERENGKGRASEEEEEGRKGRRGKGPNQGGRWSREAFQASWSHSTSVSRAKVIERASLLEWERRTMWEG